VTDVPTQDLPEQPSLEQLRNQAKDLRRAVLAGSAAASAEVIARCPGLRLPAGTPFPLRAAQLVIARRYGFTSWARLKRHVAVLRRYSRFPERITTSGDADTFLRLACLNYADDALDDG